MAQGTVTRQFLRRSIGHETRQPGFLRFADLDGAIPLTTDAISSTNVTSTSHLLQDTDWWQGQFAYLVTPSEDRLILNSSSNGTLFVEYALSSTPDSDDVVEIWSQWPGSLVNFQINRAIREGNDKFPPVISNETLIHQEFKLNYGIENSDFNQTVDDDYPAVRNVLNIWLESSINVVRGQVTSTNSATVFNDTVTAHNTSADSNWLCSIYSGVGSGQLREVTSWSTVGAITVDTDWATHPDTSSLFAMWHSEQGQQDTDWVSLTAIRFDRIRDPSRMFWKDHYPNSYGLRIRTTYLGKDTDLAADADVTYIPADYIIYKSISFLYGTLVNDNRQDRSVHAGLAEYYNQLAATYVAEHGAEVPAQTFWSEEEGDRRGGTQLVDALGWYR